MIHGADDVRASLLDLDQKVQRKIVSAGLRAGAKIIAAQIQATTKGPTGELAQKVKVRAGKRRPGVVSMLVGWFTADVPFATFADWGHKVGLRQLKGVFSNFGRAIKRTLNRSGQAVVSGKEFVEHAYDSVGDRAGDVACDAIADGIDRAWEGA